MNPYLTLVEKRRNSGFSPLWLAEEKGILQKTWEGMSSCMLPSRSGVWMLSCMQSNIWLRNTVSSIVSHKSIRITQSVLGQQLILSNFKYINYELLFYNLCYPSVVTVSVPMIILVTSKLKNEYLRQLLIKKSSAATWFRLAFIITLLGVLSGSLRDSLEFSGF